MKPFFPSIFFAILSLANAYPDEMAKADQGNAAYEAGDFRTAAHAYQAEIDEKGANADLLYNLGNAHYRLGDYGAAIYAYERALILEPRSPDIKANLALARKAATAFEEDGPAGKWLKFFYWLGLNEWLMACALALLLLAAVSLARPWNLLRKLPFPVRWITFPALCLVVVSIAAVMIRHNELDRAIVVSDGAEVKLSPFETADTKATLKSGGAVYIEGEHQGYYRIPSGWVSKKEVKPLLSR